MNPQDLSSRYTVRCVTEADIAAALELLRTNPAYFRIVPPEQTFESVAFDIRRLPPRTVPEDKFYLGFWDGETLAALLDLILHYPNRQTAFFGFFMLASSRQGRGEAAALMEEAVAALRRSFSAVRLGVAAGNTRAEHFWTKLGFVPTGVVIPEEAYKIVVMEKTL